MTHWNKSFSYVIFSFLLLHECTRTHFRSMMMNWCISINIVKLYKCNCVMCENICVRPCTTKTLHFFPQNEIFVNAITLYRGQDDLLYVNSHSVLACATLSIWCKISFHTNFNHNERWKKNKVLNLPSFCCMVIFFFFSHPVFLAHSTRFASIRFRKR